MNFTDISQLYLASADFARLEKSTSQKTYLFHINKLQKIFGLQEFFSTLDGEELYELRMKMSVAVAKDASSIFEEISKLDSDANKVYARRIFVVVWQWAERNGIVPVGVSRSLPSFRLPERNTKVVSKEDMSLASTKKAPKWMEPYRLMAMFCFYTGMRPAEAEALTWGDIKEEYIEVKNAKGRNKGTVARLCKLTAQAFSCLPRFDFEKPPDKTELVFKSLTGSKLNTSMRSVASHHLFGKDFYATRRGTATEMHNSGKYDILAISHQLGHRDIKTTQIYVRPTMLDKANSFKGI